MPQAIDPNTPAAGEQELPGPMPQAVEPNSAAGEQELPGPMPQAVEPKLQAATLTRCAEQLSAHKGPDRNSF